MTLVVTTGHQWSHSETFTMEHLEALKQMGTLHCVNIVRIQSFSDPYFPAFGINTERYGVTLHIQSKHKKIRTRNTSPWTFFIQH